MSKEEAEEDRSEVLEWFTVGRKIPELIGKLPSGEKIKGGPYRPIQLLIFGLIFVGGHMSMPWWSGVGGGGFYGIGVRYLIVLGAAVGVGFAARQIPLTMINPLLVLDGGVRQTFRGANVRWAGHPVALPRQPRQAQGFRVVVQPAPTPPAAPVVVAPPEEQRADQAPARSLRSSESKMSVLLQEKR